MAYIASATAVHAGTLRADILLVRATVQESPSEHVVRNFVFVAAGMYLWESVQCIPYDVRLLHALATRLCLGVRKLFSSVNRRNDVGSLKENSSARVSFPRFSSQSAPAQCAFSDSETYDRTLLVFNFLAQITYLCLRIFTFLALLSLLVRFNVRDSGIDLSAYDVSGAVWLGSSVVPLLSLGLSNLLVTLRAISVWRECGSEDPELDVGASRDAPHRTSVRNDCRINLISRPMIELYYCGRSMALLFLCLTLHSAQYAFIIIIGLLGSRSRLEIDERSNGRRLVIGAFAYLTFLDALALSLIVAGIVRWRNSDRNISDPDADAGNPHGSRRFSPVIFRHSCKHRPCDECTTEGGTSPHASVSVISFARKSSACTTEVDEDDSRSSLEEEGVRTPWPKSEVANEELAWTNGTTSKCGEIADHGSLSQSREGFRIREIEERRRKGKAWNRWHGRDGENRSADGNGVESRVSHRSAIASHTMGEPRVSGWVLLCREGGHQGILWALTILSMKIGVFICVLVDNYPHGQVTALDFQGVRFFAPALAIIAIASGRLFLLITRASPIGDGFMEADPPLPSPLSPCTSFVDIGIATPPIEGIPDRRLSSHPTKPITLVHVDALPSYVERRLYARRLRREMKAVADGAVRTIGGSVVPPAPALVSAQSRRSRSRQRELENENAPCWPNPEILRCQTGYI